MLQKMKKSSCILPFCIISSLIKYVSTCIYSLTTNCSCGVSTSNPDLIGRIRGGEIVDEFAMPWVAAIFKEYRFLCGATLINDRFLLSSGRCFYAVDPATEQVLYNYTDGTVAYLGTTNVDYDHLPREETPDIDILDIKTVHIHKDYDPMRRGINDLAILEALGPIERYTNKILPICLPPSHLTFEGEIAMAVGWGSDRFRPTLSPWSEGSDELRIANSVRIWRNRDCQNQFPYYNSTINICGLHNGKIPCDKDLGGPLVFKDKRDEYFLVGIISYTITCENNEPSIYTRVNSYLETIFTIASKGSYCSFGGPAYKTATKACICGLTLESRELGIENITIIPGRLMGAEPIRDGEFPWVVAIIFNLDTYLGTGTLINDIYVLTTASTMYSRSLQTQVIDVDNRGMAGSISALVGSNNFPWITSKYNTSFEKVSKYIYHPKYDGNILYGYDILLMKLREGLKRYIFNILPICLPEIMSSFEGIEATIAGFGSRGETDTFTEFGKNFMFKMKTKVHDSKTCTKERPNFLPNLLICTTGYRTGACQGDNGSPVMYKANKYQYVMIGIVSYGDCGLTNSTIVATRITEHLDWIRNETYDALYCENELP